MKNQEIIQQIIVAAQSLRDCQLRDAGMLRDNAIRFEADSTVEVWSAELDRLCELATTQTTKSQ